MYWPIGVKPCRYRGAFFSGLLLLVRFLPVTLLFGQLDIEFRGGYPSVAYFSALMIERCQQN